MKVARFSRPTLNAGAIAGAGVLAGLVLGIVMGQKLRMRLPWRFMPHGVRPRRKEWTLRKKDGESAMAELVAHNWKGF